MNRDIGGGGKTSADCAVMIKSKTAFRNGALSPFCVYIKLRECKPKKIENMLSR